MVEIEGTVEKKTEVAVLFHDGVEMGWVPFSLIEEDAEDFLEGQSVTITIPEWKAIQEGFV